MIKLTYLIKKRQDLSDDIFLKYWRVAHANLVKSTLSTLNVTKYVINTKLDTVCNLCVRQARQLAEAHYDGIIELWWPSIEAYQQGVGSPPGMAAMDAIIDAEKRFIDFSRSVAFFTEQENVFAKKRA
jgi:hypothetical protein